MITLSLERLRQDGQSLMEAVSREHHRVGAGLQPEAHLTPIYARFAHILDADTLAFVRERFEGATPGSEDHRSGRLFLEWQAEMLAQRELAGHDEQMIAWEASAMVRLPDGSRMPYQRVAIAIANSTDREERLTLERARAALVSAELTPLKRERLERERDLVITLGLADDIVSTFSLLSAIDLRALGAACEEFLERTEPLWHDTFPAFVRQRIGVDPRDATRADALALLRAPEFDRFFPPGGAERVAREHFAAAGLDVNAGGRIVHDTGEREGKRSRAFCAPVRVPQEVYLVLRPHGGQSDWRTYLHELGHALHFAYADPSLPFEYRWLGDNSVTEGYAMLLDHLMQDRGWLRRYTGLGATHVPGFLRSAAFEELHFLRRYAAKFLYELELYDERNPLAGMPELYVERLGSATSFRYDPADAFVDVDPRFYSARYLRAWQLQAVLRAALVERFDEDWYRNPRMGSWIATELLAHGQRETATELAERVSGSTLTFGPLIASIEASLGA